MTKFYLLLFFVIIISQTNCGQSNFDKSDLTIENGENLPGSSLKKTLIKATTTPEIIKQKEKSLAEVLVIGETFKTGMPLNEALSLLGTPESIKVNRGTERKMDSISIYYPKKGIRIYSLTKKNTIEKLEVLPSFKGTLPKGIKIGSKFNELINTYGIPAFKDSSIIKYPETGMYFFLKDNTLLSAKLFQKNSNLLEHKLLIQ
jgi:hypothetical protein